MSKIEVSPVNNEKRSESSGGNYNIWRKAMNEVLPFDSPDRPANVKEYGSSLNHQDLRIDLHSDAGVKPPTINRPYIRKETVNTVAERDSDDSIRMEEMPAGKSKEQIEREKSWSNKN